MCIRFITTDDELDELRGFYGNLPHLYLQSQMYRVLLWQIKYDWLVDCKMYNQMEVNIILLLKL